MNRNNDQHLAHYGIKGMKWGVRRYQNPDGSLTSAGRKRYRPNSPLAKLGKSKLGKFLEKEAQKNVDRYNKKAAKKSKKKPKRDAFSETDKEVKKLSLEDKKAWEKYLKKELGGRDQVDDGDLYELTFLEFIDEMRKRGLKHSNDEDVNDFLAHYGIKGMKWGIRRYQNRDGTRTAAGKLRDRKAASKDHKTAKALKKKPLQLLTNEELQTLNRRLQLETQYKNLRKQNVSRGRQFVSKMVTSIASEVIRNELSYAARKAINANRK